MKGLGVQIQAGARAWKKQAGPNVSPSTRLRTPVNVNRAEPSMGDGPSASFQKINWFQE